MFDWTTSKKIEMPQVKQEEGTRKRPQVRVFGQEARERDAPGGV